MTSVRLLLLLPLAVCAQTPSFEGLTIQATTKDTAGVPRGVSGPIEEGIRMHGGPGTETPERIDYKGVTLRMLLERAYGFRADQVIGPKWMNSQRYDVVAKLPVDTTPEQLRSMLEKLVIERFKIETHRENRMLPVFLLTVKDRRILQGPEQESYKSDGERRDAAQLRALAEQARARDRVANGDIAPRTHYRTASTTMPEFSVYLSGKVDRPVLDRTGLTGSYSISLEWVPAPRTDPPTIFAALQDQLGLKLERATEAAEVLVVDRAERLTSR